MSSGKLKVLFIVNPTSGPRNSYDIPALINVNLDPSKYSWEIKITEYAGHGAEICASEKNYYSIIVAVGGDGTVNEVAKELVNSQAIFGIVPAGSGNGLARHLGIPLTPVAAIQLLNKSNHFALIDVTEINKMLSFNVSGIGFDAHIAGQFKLSKRRGFYTYARLVLQEFLGYKPYNVKITYDGKSITEKKPFFISFANTCQFGNNAFIAPQASIDDGLVDICVVKNMPLWYYPVLTYRVFAGTLRYSKYYYCLQVKQAKIDIIAKDAEWDIHIDGDHFKTFNTIDIKVIPGSLKVIGKTNNPKGKFNLQNQKPLES